MSRTPAERHQTVLNIIKHSPGQPSTTYLRTLFGNMAHAALHRSLEYLEKNGDITVQMQRSELNGQMQKHYFPVAPQDTHQNDTPFQPWTDAWLLTKSWTGGTIG